MNRLLLLNGPNLNMLGKREPDVYGKITLKALEEQLTAYVEEKQWKLDVFQSNHEGELIDQIHASEGKYRGIIFNPGGYTPYKCCVEGCH